jgi:hypothetical protein
LQFYGRKDMSIYSDDGTAHNDDTTAGLMSPSQAASFMPAISQRNIHEQSFMEDANSVEIYQSADYERLNAFSSVQKNVKSLR